MLQNGVGCKMINAGRHIAQHLRQTPLKQFAKLNHCDSWMEFISDRPSLARFAFGALRKVSARLPARKNADGFVSTGVSAREEPDAIASANASGQISR